KAAFQCAIYVSGSKPQGRNRHPEGVSLREKLPRKEYKGAITEGHCAIRAKPSGFRAAVCAFASQ
ncbi:MAG TPA: hypothetical protein VLF18_02155, partial [Tahibacter sp.]|uniref:hypothetical protein n=1 Tax=Tahibacter sp. TaxID=2056211 RepID=UPI002C0D6619